MTPALLVSVVLAATPQARLGVNLTNQFGEVVIKQVETGSAAARAGLIAGDRIISLNRFPMGKAKDVTNAVSLLQPRQTVELGIVRNGRAFVRRADLGFARGSRIISQGIPIADKYDFALPIVEAHYNALNPAQKPFAAYISFEHLFPTEHKGAGLVLLFIVPSVSRSVVLDYHIPKRIGSSNVFYLDLKNLLWDQDFDTVLLNYPYLKGFDRKVFRPIVRGDFLVDLLSDGTLNNSQNDAYYRLLYGGDNIPASNVDFLNFWGAVTVRKSADARYPSKVTQLLASKIVDARNRQEVGSGLAGDIGWIETKSMVGKQYERFIEHYNTASGGYLWGTRDVLEIKPGFDPLAAPNGEFVHNGEEWIAGIPKTDTNNRTLGYLQVYQLAQGNANAAVAGDRVEEAPVRLVQDYSLFKGQTAIINSGSCVQCHGAGINPPSEYGLLALFVKGVDLHASGDIHQAIAAFHLTDVGKEVRRNGEDFSTAVYACTGYEPQTMAAAFMELINLYYYPLDIDRAARELFTDVPTLKIAILLASQSYIDLGPRVPRWLSGGTMPRTEFRERYTQLQFLVNQAKEYNTN